MKTKKQKTNDKIVRGTERRQQMRLQHELYQFLTSYIPTIPEEEKWREHAWA